MNESAQTTSEGQGELTGGADPTKGGKAPKRPIPGTLTEFLQSDYQASAYANALTKGSKVTRRPDEADRAQALLAVGQNPALLSRVAELARLMLEKTESVHLTEAIKRFASDVIRAQDDDLVNWGNNIGFTADTELGKLAARVNGARASGDKDVLQRAEHVLQIGLAVASTRADFASTGMGQPQ